MCRAEMKRGEDEAEAEEQRDEEEIQRLGAESRQPGSCRSTSISCSVCVCVMLVQHDTASLTFYCLLASVTVLPGVKGRFTRLTGHVIIPPDIISFLTKKIYFFYF